jgi:hypothetical protein
VNWSAQQTSAWSVTATPPLPNSSHPPSPPSPSTTGFDSRCHDVGWAKRFLNPPRNRKLRETASGARRCEFDGDADDHVFLTADIAQFSAAIKYFVRGHTIALRGMFGM